MFSFRIQPESDVPAAVQLSDQLQFAIASQQFPKGKRLPSLRQLEIITGLHRNTISKVYRELEALGLVKAVPGSGVYVQDTLQTFASPLQTPRGLPSPQTIFDQAVQQLLDQGYSLLQIRQLFCQDLDWRLASAAQLVITVPERELGVGQWMVQEVTQVIALPVQLISLETLAACLAQLTTATIITTPYFLQAVEAIAPPEKFQIIPLSLHNYAEELKFIKALPQNHCLGLVSVSPGILHAARTIIESLRPTDLSLLTSTPNQPARLHSLLERSQTVLCDRLSVPIIKKILPQDSSTFAEQVRLVPCQNYISETSLQHLKQTLGSLENDRTIEP
jgi:GntR family transcriptional regulator